MSAADSSAHTWSQLTDSEDTALPTHVSHTCLSEELSLCGLVGERPGGGQNPQQTSVMSQTARLLTEF